MTLAKGRLCETSWPISILKVKVFSDLGQRSLDRLPTFSKDFFSETTWPVQLNFIYSFKVKGEGVENVYNLVSVT